MLIAARLPPRMISDHPLPGELEGVGRVAGSRRAIGVEGRVGVEMEVHLAERADVDDLARVADRTPEIERVLVVASARDLARRDRPRGHRRAPSRAIATPRASIFSQRSSAPGKRDAPVIEDEVERVVGAHLLVEALEVPERGPVSETPCQILSGAERTGARRRRAQRSRPAQRKAAHASVAASLAG